MWFVRDRSASERVEIRTSGRERKIEVVKKARSKMNFEIGGHVKPLLVRWMTTWKHVSNSLCAPPLRTQAKK